MMIATSQRWIIHTKFPSVRVFRRLCSSSSALWNRIKSRHNANFVPEYPYSIMLRRNCFSTLADLTHTKNDADMLNKFLNEVKVTEKLLLNYGKVPNTDNSQEKDTIDWSYWRKTIVVPEVVDCLETLYKEYSRHIDQSLQFFAKVKCQPEKKSGDSSPVSLSLDTFRTRIVHECREAIQRLNEFITAGLKCLWISHRNPDVSQVLPDEWLDSDLWWQAYVERHHYFDSSKDIENFTGEVFEEKKNIEAKETNMMKSIALFHNRSDTPTLYAYMDQLHSFEYYTLFRRKFVEHMLYFLIRTGKDYHFFPEIPPSSWIKDIEAIRYCYLSRANARRYKKQLETLKREEPMDLLPLDSQLDDSEEYFSNLFLQEKKAWESIVGRLMMNFMFLCYPAIPVQSIDMVYSVLASDDGKGCFYSLGDDVDALFYVSENRRKPFSTSDKESHTLMASEAVKKWTEYIALKNAKVNPGYLDFLNLYAGLLDKRGKIWFCCSTESIAEGFIRRFPREDPQLVVFREYVEELQRRWKHAHKMELTEVLNKISSIEVMARETDNLFRFSQEILPT